MFNLVYFDLPMNLYSYMISILIEIMDITILRIIVIARLYENDISVLDKYKQYE